MYFVSICAVQRNGRVVPKHRKHLWTLSTRDGRAWYHLDVLTKTFIIKVMVVIVHKYVIMYVLNMRSWICVSTLFAYACDHIRVCAGHGVGTRMNLRAERVLFACVCFVLDVFWKSDPTSRILPE